MNKILTKKKKKEKNIHPDSKTPAIFNADYMNNGKNIK